MNNPQLITLALILHFIIAIVAISVAYDYIHIRFMLQSIILKSCSWTPDLL